jgi:ankyrin repeat protein
MKIFTTNKLIEAIEKNDRLRIDKFLFFLKKLEKGDTITIKDGLTPLQFACMSRRLEAADCLIKQGKVDIDGVGAIGASPLHLVCELGYTEFIPLLLDNGANKEALNRNRKTALYTACSNGVVDAVQVLLQNNAPITSDVRDWVNNSEENLNKITKTEQSLIKNRKHLNIPDISKDLSALATRKDNIKKIEQLILKK